MSDQIQLAPETPPWLPGADVEPVEIFSYYNRPLVGVVKQHGVPYLYRCLVRELADPSVWLYAPLTERELLELQEAEGGDFERLVTEYSARYVTVALVNETIRVSTQMSVANSPNQAQEVTTSLVHFLDRVIEAAQQLEQLV